MNCALKKLFPLSCYLERVEVGYFFDFFLAWQERALAAQREHELARGVALKVGCHALLAAGRVDLESGLAVEPDAAAALPGIALAAYRGMVETVELLVLDVNAAVKVAHGVALIFIVERRACVELAVRSKRDGGVAGVAVVHRCEHHAVGEQVELR